MDSFYGTELFFFRLGFGRFGFYWLLFTLDILDFYRRDIFSYEVFAEINFQNDN